MVQVNYTELKTPATDKIDGFTAIYRVTNSINGKTYIGISRDARARRWEHECRARKECKTKFHRALKKYGTEAFTWETLWYAPGYFDALDEEQRLIRILRPAYNLTAGGGGVFGLKMSAEARQKMSIAKKGKPSLNKGKTWPPEMREKISEALKGRAPIPGTLKNLQAMAYAKRKAIRCLNDGKAYSHSAEAAKYYGLAANGPARVCQGHRKYLRGYKFEWVKM